MTNWFNDKRAGDSKRIRRMHAAFGGHPGGQRCVGCTNMRMRPAGHGMYYKCTLYGDTGSDATDWRLSYPACAMYSVKPEDVFVPVMLRYRGAREEEQLEGQIRMELD